MKQSISAFLCLVSLGTALMIAAGPTVAGAEPLVVRPDDTIAKILEAQKGKVVTVRLGCDSELTGKVASVSAEVVQLSELTGKEFYDAVIATSEISAVVLRTR